MPDPRNVISVESIDANYVTLLTDAVTILFDITQLDGAAVATIGQAVSLSGNSTVQLASDAEGVIGKLISVEGDNKATVQFEGFMRLPGGSAATLTLGSSIVGALGAASAKGFIRSASGSVAAEIIRMRGRIIDAADTTNVQVDF
jgi:hypothetical protein